MLLLRRTPTSSPIVFWFTCACDDVLPPCSCLRLMKPTITLMAQKVRSRTCCIKVSAKMAAGAGVRQGSLCLNQDAAVHHALFCASFSVWLCEVVLKQRGLGGLQQAPWFAYNVK